MHIFTCIMQLAFLVVSLILPAVSAMMASAKSAASSLQKDLQEIWTPNLDSRTVHAFESQEVFSTQHAAQTLTQVDNPASTRLGHTAGLAVASNSITSRKQWDLLASAYDWATQPTKQSTELAKQIQAATWQRGGAPVKASAASAHDKIKYPKWQAVPLVQQMDPHHKTLATEQGFLAQSLSTFPRMQLVQQSAAAHRQSAETAGEMMKDADEARKQWDLLASAYDWATLPTKQSTELAKQIEAAKLQQRDEGIRKASSAYAHSKDLHDKTLAKQPGFLAQSLSAFPRMHLVQQSSSIPTSDDTPASYENAQPVYGGQKNLTGPTGRTNVTDKIESKPFVSGQTNLTNLTEEIWSGQMTLRNGKMPLGPQTASHAGEANDVDDEAVLTNINYTDNNETSNSTDSSDDENSGKKKKGESVWLKILKIILKITIIVLLAIIKFIKDYCCGPFTVAMVLAQLTGLYCAVPIFVIALGCKLTPAFPIDLGGYSWIEAQMWLLIWLGVIVLEGWANYDKQTMGQIGPIVQKGFKYVKPCFGMFVALLVTHSESILIIVASVFCALWVAMGLHWAKGVYTLLVQESVHNRYLRPYWFILIEIVIVMILTPLPLVSGYIAFVFFLLFAALCGYMWIRNRERIRVV